MKLLLHSPADPRVSLAVDDALLEQAEAGQGSELLRLWQFDAPVVVLGRSCEAAREVQLDECARRGVPVLRRVSGGGTIVAGPGCLMYSVLLSMATRPQLRHLDIAHQTVLTRVAVALQEATSERVQIRGTSDLAIPTEADVAELDDDAVRLRKVSGNSLRVKRDWLLYHGTLLLDFDLQLVSDLLHAPPRQPEYRQSREHQSFITNLRVDGQIVRECLMRAFRADEPAEQPDAELVARLVDERYANDAWNFSR